MRHLNRRAEAIGNCRIDRARSNSRGRQKRPMRFRRTKRALSALMAMLLIVSAVGARNASCLCASCGTGSSCCSAKSCCDQKSSPDPSCGCCPEMDDRAATGSPAASAPAAPKDCQCSISSAPNYVAPITRSVSSERTDLAAIVSASPSSALQDGPTVRNVEFANLFAASGPPFRMLYCSWLE